MIIPTIYLNIGGSPLSLMISVLSMNNPKMINTTPVTMQIIFDIGGNLSNFRGMLYLINEYKIRKELSV